MVSVSIHTQYSGYTIQWSPKIFWKYILCLFWANIQQFRYQVQRGIIYKLSNGTEVNRDKLLYNFKIVKFKRTSKKWSEIAFIYAFGISVWYLLKFKIYKNVTKLLANSKYFTSTGLRRINRLSKWRVYVQ